MKHTLRLVIIAIVITILAATLTCISTSAATANVVYISADGTGDGSSPDKPLGNKPGYVPGVKTEPNNAFYRGLEALKSKGGTLVIVGEVAIDCVESRFSNANTTTEAPSEFRCPKFAANTKLTVTSVYNGVDYRNQGAKLIFDYETCNTTAFAFTSETLIEKLNIQYKYVEGVNNSWQTPFMLGGGGYNLTIGEEVDVTSFNVSTNSEGDQYPILIGGHRYSVIDRSFTLTVKSGTWSLVVAGSFGIPSNSYGKITGNVTLNVLGGKIEKLVGTGSPRHLSETIHGSLDITVLGGEINELCLVHSKEFAGTRIGLTIAKDANISSFAYAPIDYSGSVSELVAKTTIKNSSNLKITLPEGVTESTQPPAATTPAATTPTDTDKETVTTSAQENATTPPPTATAQSETVPEATEEGPVIPYAVWIILIIVAAAIGTGSFVINKIKMNMLK